MRVGSARGIVTLHAKAHEGQRRGVLIAESIWPNDAFEDGQGINTLTGCDQPAPMAAAPSTTTGCGSGRPEPVLFLSNMNGG